MAATPIFNIPLPTPGADDDAWAPVLNDAIIDLEAEVSRVDGATAGIALDLTGKINRSADTMSGFLTLNADPTAPLHAATRQYVLANSAGLTDAPNDGALYGRKSAAWVKGVQLAGDTMTGALVVSGSSTSAMLRVTQLGTGNAIVVEDSANPDATPFVVDATGKVGIGTPTPTVLLDVIGNVRVAGAAPSLILDYDGVTNHNIQGRKSGVNLWNMQIGAASAAAPFYLYRYDDAAAQSLAFSIDRLTGHGSIGGTPGASTRFMVKTDALAASEGGLGIWNASTAADADVDLRFFTAGGASRGRIRGQREAATNNGKLVLSTFVGVTEGDVLTLGSNKIVTVAHSIEGTAGQPGSGEDYVAVWRKYQGDGGLIAMRGLGDATNPNGTDVFAGTTAARKAWQFKTNGALIAPGNISIPQGSAYSLNGGNGAVLTVDSSAHLLLQVAPGYYMARWGSGAGAGSWAWAENNTTNMSLDGSGNLWAKGMLQGTGLSTPNAVFGDIPGMGTYIKNAQPSGPNYLCVVSNSNPNWAWCPHQTILVPGVVAMHRFQLDSFFFEMSNSGAFARGDGYYVSWNPPSDARMKQNVQPAKVDALALINAVEMVAFDWTDAALEAMAGTDIDHKPVLKPRHVELGAIAQQVATLKETLTAQQFRSEPREGVPDDPLSVDWGACMPYALRAIQQLSARIEALETPA